MANKTQVGSFLKERRKKAGLTQQEFAERLSSYGLKFGVSTIGWWETGRTFPPLKDPNFINALALTFEMSVNELLDGLGFLLPGGNLNYEDLSSVERELLDAYRRGDFKDLMRIAAKKPDTQGA